MLSQQEDLEVQDYTNRCNALLNRLKKAIDNNTGIRLSAEDVKLMSTMSISQIILAEE